MKSNEPSKSEEKIDYIVKLVAAIAEEFLEKRCVTFMSFK
jgi:hypothetical protein